MIGYSSVLLSINCEKLDTLDEAALLWNDPVLDIDWGLDGEPLLSAKDVKGKTFEECEKYE